MVRRATRRGLFAFGVVLIAALVAFAMPPAKSVTPAQAGDVGVPMHHCVFSGGGWLGTGPNCPHEGEQRIAGADRYETAVKISQEFWTPEEATRVYLATGAAPWDALAAGASVEGGPILLVPPGDTVPQVVLDEISRLQPDLVTALGGDTVVSPTQLWLAGLAAGFGG